MTATVTEPLTNAQLADHAFAALGNADVLAVDALRIVELLPPRGHHELTTVLTEHPDALTWLPAMWIETFTRRFRTFSDADSADIQRLLAKAAQR